MEELLKGYSDIRKIKGIGDKTAQLFSKIGVGNVYNLIHYYPRDYEIFEEPVPIKEASVGEMVSIFATVVKTLHVKKVRNLTILTILAADAGAEIKITFFNMPYLQSRLRPGERCIFRGMIQNQGAQLIMDQPQLFDENAYRAKLGGMQPKYALTAGLTNNVIIKAMKYALSCYEWDQDYMPVYMKEKLGLADLRTSLCDVHFPDDMDQFQTARNRLVFDEFFMFILGVRKLKQDTDRLPNTYQMARVTETDRLLAALPYSLTDAQKNVWEEIQSDLTGEYAMNRLIQGDVGSGKTILAFLSLLMCVANGYQGALMAPTEVLANQHYESLMELKEAYHLDIKPILLTGSMNAREKRRAYERIELGMANIIIGTHALIQGGVTYCDLALVITDEQHRFGVRQREFLAEKGDNVHVLVMSATPIPRTLAIILYGDLHLSVINELPANRLPIKNCVIDRAQREKAYAFLLKQLQLGRQAYIICPMIDEGDTQELENVTNYIESIRDYMPDNIRIGALHGKMKAKGKNQVMDEYAAHNIDILIATTVIEVGINVPNATVMMIENAERFGLAQLHQLRGRVGRGKEQSYCIFVNGSKKPSALERLDIINSSNDGFHIAEADLKLRGPGDLFGIRQSGIMDFKIGDIYQDASVLQKAGAEVERLMEEDKELVKEEHLSIKKYLAQEEIKFVDFRTI